MTTPRKKETIALGSGGVTFAGEPDGAGREQWTAPEKPPEQSERVPQGSGTAHGASRVALSAQEAAPASGSAVNPMAETQDMPQLNAAQAARRVSSGTMPNADASRPPSVAPFVAVPSPESYGRPIPGAPPQAQPPPQAQQPQQPAMQYQAPPENGPPPPMANPPQQQPPAGGSMPRAPKPDRSAELAEGAGGTMYEFQGTHADAADRGRRGTFVGGADLDLSSSRAQRETNLQSGASTWIFVILAVLLGGGAVAYFTVLAPERAEPEDKPDPNAAVAEAVDDKEEKAVETKEAADAKKAEDAEAEDAKAEDAKAAEAKKAEDAKAAEAKKAEDAKAAEEAKKAEDAKKADDPPEPAPAADKPKPKKKSTGGGSKPKKSSSGGKTLKSKKKPRKDPFKGLPKPP